MSKPRHRLLLLSAIASGLVFALTASLWARSYSRCDAVIWSDVKSGYKSNGALSKTLREVDLISSLGGVRAVFEIQEIGATTKAQRTSDGWHREVDEKPEYPVIADAAGGFPVRFSQAGFQFAYHRPTLTERARTRIVSITIPHWIVFLCSGIVVVWCVRRYRRARALGPTQCTACGYDLRATPNRCPECGAIPLSVPHA